MGNETRARGGWSSALAHLAPLSPPASPLSSTPLPLSPPSPLPSPPLPLSPVSPLAAPLLSPSSPSSPSLPSLPLSPPLPPSPSRPPSPLLPFRAGATRSASRKRPRGHTRGTHHKHGRESRQKRRAQRADERETRKARARRATRGGGGRECAPRANRVPSGRGRESELENEPKGARRRAGRARRAVRRAGRARGGSERARARAWSGDGGEGRREGRGAGVAGAGSEGVGAETRREGPDQGPSETRRGAGEGGGERATGAGKMLRPRNAPLAYPPATRHTAAAAAWKRDTKEPGGKPPQARARAAATPRVPPFSAPALMHRRPTCGDMAGGSPADRRAPARGLEARQGETTPGRRACEGAGERPRPSALAPRAADRGTERLERGRVSENRVGCCGDRGDGGKKMAKRCAWRSKRDACKWRPKAAKNAV